MAYKQKSPIPIVEGGTNAITMTNTDGVVYFDGTSLVTTAVGSSTQVLTSNGAGMAPTFQASGGGGMAIKTTTFTTSGTWTKDASSETVIVYGWNGGAGGGSGAQSTTGNACGGGGGGAPACFYYEATSNFFNATETVTIGAAGVGGAAQTSANTAGNDGTVGGLTLFGNIGVNNVASSGGPGGTPINGGGGQLGGQGNGPESGLYLTVINQTFVLQDPNNAAGAGQLGAGSNATNIGNDVQGLETFAPGLGFMGTGGGGGSGAVTGTPQQAGYGGDVQLPAGGFAIIAGGVGGIDGGTIDGAPGNPGLVTTGGRVLGGTGGGGGGGQATGVVAGNGGVGGFPGGSGGGGGGSINGTDSGAGGDGAAGLVIVVEFI
jgi:hypothetical protein